jgi:PAS domain S-box-containing protein
MASNQKIQSSQRFEKPAIEMCGISMAEIQHPPTVIFVANENGKIVCCNSQIEILTGYRAEEMLGHNCLDLLPVSQTGQTGSLDFLSNPNQNNERPFESTLISRDGHLIPVEIQIHPVDWQNQSASLFILKELPSNKEIPSEQTSSRTSPEAEANIIAVNRDGIITYVSTSASRLVGWRNEDVSGRSVIGTFGPEFHRQITQIINIIPKRRSWYAVIPVMRPDGSVLSFLIKVNPVLDQNENLVSINCVFQDILLILPESDLLVSDKIRLQPSGLNTLDNSQVNDGQHHTTLELIGKIQSRFETVREQLNQISESLSRDQKLIRQLYSTLQAVPVDDIPDYKIELSPSKFRLEIFCLGILKVCSTTTQVQRWQSNRAKSVFEYLITKRSAPVSRDILMDVLWPDYPSRAAANNLKTAIHDLRQNLSPLFGNSEFPVILLSHEGYMINPEIELLVDSDSFEMLWNRGKHLEKEGETIEGIRHFEKAEALYQGDYLADSLYEEWTISRRETLKDIYLLIINKLADYSMNNADYENCITYCHKILEKDNCREDTYRMLMSSYSRLRQKNNALRWYVNCCQTLISELGSHPSAETVSLFHRLKRDETI